MKGFARVGGASVVMIGVVGFLILVLWMFSSQFYYLFARVEEQEIGIQFRGSQIHNIVGPGIYSDFGFFVELQTISTESIPFTVQDDEMITKDKQRIGLVVSGDIFRPNINQADVLRELWSQYRPVYLDDNLAASRVQDLSKQSMKVCVGERTFDDSIIGNARDALRACIDEQVNQLAANFGLRIQNVVVPEVILSPEVQSALDAIVQSRLATEKAAQDKLKADAEANADQARQEGEIRVAQSRIQEESRQQTKLAELEREKIEAQKAVIEAERANELARVEAERAIIEAQKANELLAAEQDLAINQAKAEAAIQRAKADLAEQLTLAELYANHPDYLELQIMRTNADALNSTDKIIFTPEGTVPNMILSGPGIMPTVDAAPTVPSNSSDKNSDEK